jgi:aminopeptidase N
MPRLALLVVALVLAGAAAASAAAPLAHDLQVRLQPATGEILVIDTITVEGRQDLSLDLAPWLAVSAVAVDGVPMDGVPVDIDGPIVLRLPGSGIHRVRLEYGGRLGDGAGNGVGDGAGIRPRIAADGVVLPAFGGWLPRAGHEAVTHRLSVEVPAGYRAVATGRLIAEAEDASAYRATYEEARPGEGPSLFAGRWQVAERRVDDIRLRTWFDADNAWLSDLYLDRAAALVRHYAATIGAYPYADLHIVAAAEPVGISFPGVLYVSHRILPLPFMQGRSLAHEILHSWWGNGVGVDYTTGNWAEGLTTYMADHWLAEEQGLADARTMRLSWLRDYRALPAARDFPIVAFTARQHDAAQVVGYGKAAFVFHMLRSEIGEPAFAAGIRLFWRDNRWRVAGWADLRHAFETASGRDLDWFFDQWLRRSGAPSLALDGVDVSERDGAFALDGVDVSERDGAFALSVAVVQRGDARYRLSVPLRVTTAGGRVHETIALADDRSTATVVLAEPPIEVAIDPDFDVFRRLSVAETPPILRDVTLDPTASVVLAVPPDALDAARSLAARLMDGPPRLVDREAANTGPLLLIAVGDRLDPALQGLDLDPMPGDLAGQGSARVWTGRRLDDHAYVIVAADDAAALAALAGPLPHHSRSGYLAFDGRQVLASGLRPSEMSPLTRRFDGSN